MKRAVLVRDSDGREVENKGTYLGLNSKLQNAAGLTEVRKLSSDFEPHALWAGCEDSSGVRGLTDLAINL
jgi:hypothetical protein